APPFEIMFGRRFKGRLLPFGEKCIFFRPSRHKGDLQWESWKAEVFADFLKANNGHLAAEEAAVLFNWDAGGVGPTELAELILDLFAGDAPSYFIAKDGGASRSRNQQDSRSHQGLQIDAQEVRGDSTNIRMCPDHRPHVMNYHQGEEHPSEQGQLYPPGYAGVSMVHGDIMPQELAGYEEWDEDLQEAMVEESELAGEFEAWWDEDGETPPELSEEELRVVDNEADKKEITRLIQMGVARWPAEGEDVSGYQVLTTKVVRDWRKRPGWLRRSRLVGREFRTMAAYTQELFAPASTLASVHMFISWAVSKGLEVTTIDVKDAYLNVPQPSPVTIQVEKSMFGGDTPGTVTLVLDRLLPGQRIGASAWYGYARDILHEAGLESFIKEPTLFRSKEKGNDTALILHADDGLLASTRAERAKFEATFGAKVTLQVDSPLAEVGDSISFLKRKYVKVPEGVAVYSNSRYLESLRSALGPKVKPRDSPADNSFLEPDNSRDLGPADAKLYKESVGRLLYLAHSRPDVQFPVCILSSKMSAPTAMAMKWLHRVVGYLLATPEIGFIIKPLRNGGCFSFEGNEELVERDGGPFKVILESITDADWGGCKRTRRSRSSMQYYVAGSLVGSAVRTQKSIALSSAESEFIAILGGACEALYLKDCLGYLANGEIEIEIRCRSDSASARAISQRLGCGRVRHLHAGSLWIQSYVKRSELTVGPIAGDPYGQPDKEAADEKRALSQALKNFTSAGAKVSNIKAVLPMLLMLTQVDGAQGLSLVTWEPEDWVLLVVTAMVGAISILVVFGLPYGVFKLLKWSLGKVFRGSKGGAAREPRGVVEPQISSASKQVQASLGMSKKEESFCEEYVARCTEAEMLLAQKCSENEGLEEALRNARAECRRLQAAIDRLRVRREPETAHVTTSRGTRFHLPGCSHIRNSQIRVYTACRDCFGG
ncbi:unnamed protein product, partial [Symbiodinium sp. KB8]